MAIYKLEEIIQVISGNSKLTKKYVDANNGEFGVVSSSSFNNGIFGYINTFMYEKGITISKDGSIGNVFWQDKPFSINTGAFLVKPKDLSIINEKYLFFLLKTKEKRLKQIGDGSVIKHIYAKDINNLEAIIPDLKTQNSIIDIIEPIEQLKNTINKIKLILKKHLILIYKLNQSSKEPIKNQIIIKNKKYKNEKFYCPTSLVSELSLNKENLILLDQTKKPSRADLTIEDNSFIFSKIIGENKLMIFSKAPNIVFSTGFFNIKSKNETNDHLLSFLLSNDFIYQKNQLQTGTLMQSLNKENLNKIFIKKDILYSNNLFSQLSNLINLEKNINSILKKILKIFI
ncbi:restriction endonuclease subunit S [Mesomycoplasma neurolyticum]|uniref:Restriction modification enzyme subunit S2A n=1 Tax=Mesomycoplasma neurolyticum TaxID=2120 RepID=A0A449A4W1_9BACT|nr:restriction endonuclease subunit S [Mesomycoplasma neurolyticum]VEU59262.1 restriction modification enzyme subunit S2A [Mesomycoplasma neurolyticum]